ncbi:MAG: helix-turn-helix domain-containing protein [Ruminococcus sp.]|uniref:helix-turn-helix domain-containing protein n=1 Tax=Ruminococcus sp. TaxID=41978 RepID=UPI0025EC1034|nr:helix-turn-helix transcriptional regulator [Ruminococcus sp.]MCR5600360.1 helix-turn-helix domain-containing protein [Ruminococcus sp.]
MNFADKLKQIRKDRKISQEDLAEMLDVSRQAVSKWEQGTGYPEVEKLLLLSDTLNISLDSLMGSENVQEKQSVNVNITGNIIITSPNENVIVTCYKVCSSQEMKGRAGTPKYFLMGFSGGGNPFLGEPATLLGWYADKDSISKEISEIQNALEKGVPSYELKYSAKVKRHLLSIKIVND